MRCQHCGQGAIAHDVNGPVCPDCWEEVGVITTLKPKTETGMKLLEIDEKWSVQYDPERNDRPVAWFRHGEYHSLFSIDNAQTAMFYKLLEMTDGK